MDNIELQQGLNSVVTAKVQRMIENKRPVVEQTIARLIQERGDAQDYSSRPRASRCRSC